LITKDKIDSFIKKIPPSSKVLKVTLSLLDAGELAQAAQIAKEDLALSTYLKHLVNKPIYGFKNQVDDISQIFGILGVAKSQQAVYNYMMSLLSPKEWSLFALKQTSFHNLQDTLSINWQIILKHLQITDKEIQSSITLLPASIIVCEALFNEKKENVALLRSASDIDLNTILQRLCKIDLFDICEMIAIKWEMNDNIALVMQAASGIKPAKDTKINLLGKWMHLLLFHTLSQTQFIDAELNDFIDFQIEYVEEIYEDFAKVMDVQ
jgi:HD-like signal output (HDOD) protein